MVWDISKTSENCISKSQRAKQSNIFTFPSLCLTLYFRPLHLISVLLSNVDVFKMCTVNLNLFFKSNHSCNTCQKYRNWMFYKTHSGLVTIQYPNTTAESIVCFRAMEIKMARYFDAYHVFCSFISQYCLQGNNNSFADLRRMRR